MRERQEKLKRETERGERGRCEVRERTEGMKNRGEVEGIDLELALADHITNSGRCDSSRDVRSPYRHTSHHAVSPLRFNV